MKTTIDIPDALYRRAKILTARRGTTSRNLVLGSLEKELSPAVAIELNAKGPAFTASAHGFPVLTGREDLEVSDELVNRIREEEGI